MSKTKIVNDSRKSGHMSDDDIPDDFFDELTDSRFIDELFENAQDNSDNDGNNENSEDSPRMARCLAEINTLSKDIERRKKKIEAELSDKGVSDAYLRKKTNRSGDGTDIDMERRDRRARDRERDQWLSRSRSRSRSRSSFHHRGSRHFNDDNRRHHHHPSRSKSRSRHRKNRSRSNSPRSKRSSSTHKNLTFLEELAQTFAEKGQAFPEKDLLLNKASKTIGSESSAMAGSNQLLLNQPMPMDYTNQAVTMPYQQQYPQMGYPVQNMYYGMNSMNIMGGMPPQPPQQTLMPTGAIRNITNISTIGATQAQLEVGLNPERPALIAVANDQKALLEKCSAAIKAIRAEENKVPKSRFLFTRTTVGITNNEIENSSAIFNSPLHSNLNPLFKFNAPDNVKKVEAPLKQLPPHTKEIVKALGIDSSFLFAKMRSKDVASKLCEDFQREEEKHKQHELDRNCNVDMPSVVIEPKKVVELAHTEMQTEPYHCEKCTERKKIIMLNKHTQVFPRHGKGSIGTQTDEEDYREPIVELLARMTAAQLVAIKDFANIITEPMAQSGVEIFKVRERMMDVYNLSQRDADAVRNAQQNRLDDIQMVDQLRFRNDNFCDVGSSREFDHRSNSPMRMPNGGSASRGVVSGNGFNSNFNQIDFNNEQRMIEDRRNQHLAEERQRIIDEREMRRLQEELEQIEMVRLRRIREEQEFRIREEQERKERERRIQQGRFEQDAFMFNNNRDSDEYEQLNNAGWTRGSAANKRSRGAFRDNHRGRGRGR